MVGLKWRNWEFGFKISMVKSMNCPHQTLDTNSSTVILNGKLEVHVDYHSIDHEGIYQVFGYMHIKPNFSKGFIIQFKLIYVILCRGISRGIYVRIIFALYKNWVTKS